MSARLMRCLGLALVTLAGGACVFRTYETRPVATLGYHRPRTVALVFTHGDPGLAASLRQRLVGSGLVSVGSERIATLEDGTEPEALCRALTGVAAPVAPAPAPPVGRVGDPVVPPVPASPTASDPRFPPPPTPPGPTTASPAPTASDPRFPPPPTSPAPPTSPPTTSDPRFPPPPTPPALPVTSAGPPGAGVPAPEAPPLPPPPPPGTAPVTGHDPDGRPPEPPRPSPWLREAPITSPGAPIAPPFPADLIVVVDARVAVHSDFHCPIYRAKVEWSWPKDDDDDGGGGGGGCSDWSYDATDGLARARLVALSPTTCSIIQDVADQADSRVVGRDAIDGEAKARAAAIDALRARDLAALVERFLPHGLEVVAARGPGLELSGPTTATLTVGQTYPLVGTRRDGRTQLGRLRVDRADADGAVGVVDPSPLPLRLGDEVRSLSYPHEWKLVPVLTAGDLVADARSSTVVGVGLGLRWTYPRAYLQGELLLSDQWVLDFDTKRYDLGVALGGRLPLGPLVPYAMGELGGAFLPREQLGDTTTYHTKSFQGVVGGLEVWAGRYVFLVDARLRRATGVALGTAITETYRERTLQLGFAAPI